MPFKDISYHHFVQRNETICVIMEEMPFNDISYQELWQPFGSVEQNHLCNFGIGCYKEQFYFEFWASGSGDLV